MKEMATAGRPWHRLFSSCFRNQAEQEPSASHTNDEDFYRFQSGRWLWDEQKQLDKRYRKFNVSALQEIAVASVGAKRCVSMTKISEVGGNKVFRLAMDNRKAVIAKIPHWRADSGSLRVASEVATMDFASTILGIPVPKVLAWHAQDDCSVGTEYIIMEEARGTLLDTSWDDMHLEAKAEVLGSLASIAAKFQSVSFSDIGNLYFAADNIPGSRPAIVNGSLTPDQKARIAKRYVIGPTTDHSYWKDDRAKLRNAQGPWHDPKDWLKAVATREITWLQQYAPERRQLPLMPAPMGTRADHIGLWTKFEAATDFLSSMCPEFLHPTLWHADLCTSNIFVKKNKITAVIDWEGSGITPLMFAAQNPKLLMPPAGVLPEIPGREQMASMSDEQKMRAAVTIQWHYLRYVYQATLHGLCPLFERLEQVLLLRTLQQLVLQASDTWTHGAVPMRGCLITLAEHWSKVCLDRPCPYNFTPDELMHHANEEARFGVFASMIFMTHGAITGEGFIKSEMHEGMLELFVKIRQSFADKEGEIEGDIDNEILREEVLGALAWAADDGRLLSSSCTFKTQLPPTHFL